MKLKLTPALLGDLIEKGYSYLLADSNDDNGGADGEVINLKAVKKKPDMQNLPDGFETFYMITREPMQMACGIDGTTVLIEHDPLNEEISEQNLFDDRYFRMSEDFFRQVLDSLEDYAVFTTDTNGDVNSWNSGAEKILGYTEPEVLGLSAKIFFTQEDQAVHKPELELTTALKNGRSIDERYHVRKNKSQFWGSGLVFPLYDEEQNHRGYTKIMRNQREQIAAEQHGAG